MPVPLVALDQLEVGEVAADAVRVVHARERVVGAVGVVVGELSHPHVPEEAHLLRGANVCADQAIRVHESGVHQGVRAEQRKPT